MLRQRSTIIRLNSGSKVTVQTRSELTSKRTRLLYEPMACTVSMESARGGDEGGTVTHVYPVYGFHIQYIGISIELSLK